MSECRFSLMGLEQKKFDGYTYERGYKSYLSGRVLYTVYAKPYTINQQQQSIFCQACSVD